MIKEHLQSLMIIYNIMIMFSEIEITRCKKGKRKTVPQKTKRSQANFRIL